MYNNNNQNPDQNMNRLPDVPTSYIVFLDGNMSGKELKCSCGKIYAWLDKSNLMTGECRNDPVISAFLKDNYHYDTRKDTYESYISRSNQNYHSPPRISDRDYYRHSNDRSRRSPSPYHHSQSRYSSHRERRHSRSYSGSRSRSRSGSPRRRSRRYGDDNYPRSRDNMYRNNRNYIDGPGNINQQPPVIQYPDTKQDPLQQQPLPPSVIPLQQQQQQQQQRVPVIQVPSIQQLHPSQIPPLQQQQQQPVVQNPTTPSPPLLNNNNNNNNNNNRQESSWSSSSSRDKAWATYDDNSQPPQHNNNNNNNSNGSSLSPLSDSDNSSTNSNYLSNTKPNDKENDQKPPSLQQQQQQDIPEVEEESTWDVPKPINELNHKYPGKTMDEVGREQLIADVQEWNRYKGLDSSYDSVAHSVDYQLIKNRVLLRIEYIVKTVDKCPLSRISSLYEEKYGEKLDLQKDLGYKKLSKCLENYGFKQQPMVNLTIVTPSNKIWF